MQVKEFAAADLPVNTTAPSVSGTGYQSEPLTCNHGTWNAAAGSTRWVTWYRANKIPTDHPRYRAPNQLDYNNTTTPPNTALGTGTANLTWLDAQIVGEGDTYTPTGADLGKTVYCQVSVDNAGATVFKTALAPEIIVARDGQAGGTVPATLSLTLGAPATFEPFVPGVEKDYSVTSTAKVISTAGDAALSVSDPGRMTNGAFTLAEPLRVAFSKSTWTAPTSNEDVGITFRQLIKRTDPLRTGTYSKTLTFTLSTTTP
jgi:hypothetical protein